MTMATLTRREAPMLRMLADRLRPKPRTRPSVWVEANVSLSDEQSAARPGPFRCDYLPFQRALHDAEFDNPLKAGVIGMKCAQIGWTQTRMNLHAYKAVHEPGPRLYVVDKEEKAKQFGTSGFKPMVERVRSLRDSVQASTDEGRRQTMTSIAYLGGRLDITTAGSEITSIPYIDCDLDEYEASMKALPAGRGDLFTSSLNRTRMFRHRSRINVFGHPRWYDEGIHLLYTTISDQRRWVFDCPHCGQPVFPLWEHVRFGRIADETTGRPDPASAVLHCPHCGEPITDAQRARALWPKDISAEGTGRFLSELPDDVAFSRPYIGLWVVRLCDPRITVQQLADEWCHCKSESKRMDFLNKTQGEPAREVTAVVRVGDIAKCFDKSTTLAPGGPRGVRVATIGIDVQRPRGQRNSGLLNQHIFYVSLVGWAGNGFGYCTALDRFQGTWEVLEEYITGAVVRIDAGGGEGQVVPSLVSIDAGDDNSEVLDFCRREIWSRRGPSRIRLSALNYRPHIKFDSPIQDPGEKKKTHPTRTDVGTLDYWYLNRHIFVDRAIRRLTERRMVFLCPEPSDFREQITANMLVPVKSQHGMASDTEEWFKPKEKRDDWLQCLAFCEAGALIHCRLDNIMDDATDERPVFRAPSFGEHRGYHR